jgi:hypothetical protein
MNDGRARDAGARASHPRARRRRRFSVELNADCKSHPRARRRRAHLRFASRAHHGRRMNDGRARRGGRGRPTRVRAGGART